MLSFFDVLDRLLELVVGELRADFTAALHEEQLVERVHENGRRHVVQRLAQRRIVLQVLRTDLTLILIPEHLNLALSQVGQREHFAVHFHDDLLDDDGLRLRAESGRGGDEHHRSDERNKSLLHDVLGRLRDPSGRRVPVGSIF